MKAFAVAWLERWRRLPRAARWVVAGGAAIGAVASTGLAVLPSLVRSAVRERAEARGLQVELGSVGLGAGRLWLREVRVKDPKLGTSEIGLSAVAVRLGFTGVKGVEVRGGRARLEASEKTLEDAVRRWRGSSATVPAGGGTRRVVDVSGLDLDWRDPTRPGERLVAWGISATNAGAAGMALSADLVQGRYRRIRGRARGIAVELMAGPERRIRRVDVAKVFARVELGGDSPELGVALPAPAAPARWPERIAALGASLGKRTSDAFRASVVSVDVEVVRGDESLRLGPNSLRVSRDASAFGFELAPHARPADARTRLGLRGRIPLRGGDLELELRGGPVSLATLGVRDGDFGLIAPRDTRLEMDARLTLRPSDAKLSFESRGLLEHVRLFRPAFSRQELSGIRLGWSVAGQAALDGSELVLRQSQVSLGEARAELEGEIERGPDRTRLRLSGGVPAGACNTFLDSLPEGAAPLLAGVRLSGVFGLKTRIAYDSQKPKATAVVLDVTHECRVVEFPARISPNRFRTTWLREVKGADGASMLLESGPGSEGWTPYSEISPHLETAVLVSEDSGFYRHRGINFRALERSIHDNLAAGRFLRGGSTISMQLAKNLYLTREKTLARKVQEAVLTSLLEQQLSKQELMELYLNVIEFGPGLYGVGAAARYYFNETPRALSLGQALYLASILPNPDAQHFLPDGRVTERWSAYLRKLMGIARQIDRITDAELEAGLGEQVAFRRPNVLSAASAVAPGGEPQDAPPPELPPQDPVLQQPAPPELGGP